MENLSKSQGMMVGMALGDALGYRVEFLGYQELITRYRGGIQEPPLSGDTMLYSDDTQMAVALAQGLLREGGDWHQNVADAFVRWLRSPDNNRAPGTTCIQACRNLARGVQWEQAGNPNSKGCGSVMRVAPVGILHWNDLDRLRQVAAEQSQMTHGHPTAISAAVAGAFIVASIMRETKPGQVLPQTRAFVAEMPGSQETTRALDAVARLLDAAPMVASEALGSGWVAEEALAIALWAFLRTPGDYVPVIRRAVNYPGRGGSCDRDSVGAIAGVFAGTYNGLEGIPAEWARQVENRDLLLQIGVQLVRRAE